MQCLKFFGWLVFLSLPFAGSALSGEPEQAQSAHKASEKESAVAEVTSTTEGALNRYLHALLIDNEAPIFGAKWGGAIFVDLPLNGEPTDSQITLRRAQVTFWKTFNVDWKLKLSLQFSTNGNLELNDNYVTYSGWNAATVKLGVFSPPYSVENTSSTNGITFMERALPVTALTDSKAFGFGWLKRTRSSIIDAGIFLASAKADNVPANGQAVIFHYVHSPIDTQRGTSLNLGASLSYRINVDADRTRYKTKPEIAVSDISFIDTGEISGANTVSRIGLEASSVHGRFSWQSEVLGTTVKRTDYDQVDFIGGYVFASWFLTRDSRNYNSGNGQYDPVIPNNPVGKGGKGAFELALRASFVDLNDKDIIGGEESNITLGFNWYLNSKFRVMTNLVKVLDVKRPDSQYDGEDPLIFAMRIQWLMH